MRIPIHTPMRVAILIPSFDTCTSMCRHPHSPYIATRLTLFSYQSTPVPALPMVVHYFGYVGSEVNALISVDGSALVIVLSHLVP